MNYLDDGIDELAAKSFDSQKIRLVLGVLVAGLAIQMVPVTTGAIWLCATFVQEGFSWVVSYRQGRGETGTRAMRAAYLASLITGCAVWFTIGGLLWVSGTPEGATVAVILWLSVIFFTQTNAYQSPLGFVVGGALPGLAMLVFVALGPNPLSLSRPPLVGFLGLALAFSMDGVFRAVAARRKFDEAQEQLAASQGKYRVLADNLTDVISMTDTTGQKLYVSPSLGKVLGYTPDEWFLKAQHESLHPEDSKWLPGEIAKFVRTGGEMTHQYRIRHHDGQYIWMETSFSLVPPDELGGPSKVLTVSRPIEGRKTLETQLVEARRRAEDAAAAKSDFLANMTHELRTPLNAIVGFSEILRRSDRLTQDDRRYVGLVHSASVTLLELVSGILDFSKLEAGGVELETHAFDPAAPPRAVLDLLAGQAESRDIWTSLETQGTIRPLVGDDSKIRQVLLNLVSNALKFTHAGGVTVRVQQSSSDDLHDRLRIEVADTGIGISPHQIETLFDRFTQADASVSREYGGTGLGLAICRRTIDLMGGEIGAFSEPGKGSTFWFEVTLPWTDCLEVVPEPPAPQGPEHPLRLLLVEDVAVNRELVQTLLHGFEVEIETAENGQAALEALAARRFDMVLMDVHMPILDGLSATRAFRATDTPAAQTTPVIAMTANVLPEQIEKCLEAGMDDHIGKPISPSDLLHSLAKWSEGRDRDAGKMNALA